MSAQGSANLKYFAVSGKCLTTKFKSEYQTLFEFWKRRWSSAYEEIGLPRISFSDGFTRQAEVTALFLDGKPLGCLCLDWFDLSDPVHLGHSYFSEFKQNIVSEFQKENVRQALVINYLTVDPMAARHIGRLPVADLLSGLAVLRLVSTNLTHMLAFSRNTRKTNELMYRMGGRPIVKSELAYNEPADFGLFDRESLDKVGRSDHSELIFKLWGTRHFEKTEIDELSDRYQATNKQKDERDYESSSSI